MIGIIEYIPKLNVVRHDGDLIIGKIHLTAGKNEVDTEEWAKFANHPLIKPRIEQGIIRVSFDKPTIITSSNTISNKKEKTGTRYTTQIETELEPEPTPSPAPVIDTTSFVVRPTEVEKPPSAKK